MRIIKGHLLDCNKIKVGVSRFKEKWPFVKDVFVYENNRKIDINKSGYKYWSIENSKEISVFKWKE